MRVSINWVKQYVDFELPPIDKLAEKIGAQLGAIETIEDLGASYSGAIVARVVSIADHPNADRLHVCLIDDGGTTPDVTRDKDGRVQVVCGATNLHDGMLVAWLPPGTVVPESVGKEPFTLEARDFRGVMSNGMLASARELRLGTDHSGILELDVDAKPGDRFADAYRLDDYVIDIENKMFTHRPDLFGELGVAREIAGILGKQFTSPDWYKTPKLDALPRSSVSLPLEVRNELPELVPRFVAVSLSNITIKPSPMTVQTYLLRCGLRPINNVVDITNYMMLLTGQPLHAYDYDKVKALSTNGRAVLSTRHPHAGEKIKLLNGKEIEPRSEAIMIATDKQLIGVGGIMGGADTEVDDNTKNVILECATFDMYSVRRTSMAHGLFTDAVSRFNKGQSPLQNSRVLGEALRMFGELAGAQQASDVVDDNQLAGREWVHPPIPVTIGYINDRLGLGLSADEMKRLLENVECRVDSQADQLTVSSPFWRTDLELREDIVEEIGRLYGYDHLPLTLPMRAIEPTKKDPSLELKAQIREALSRAGANEVLTYSFVHGKLLDKVGQDESQAFQLSNAISPDLQYYRLSLTPSLLDRIHPNIKAGYDQFAVFEIGTVHSQNMVDEEGLPRGMSSIGLVVVADPRNKSVGAPYYEARKYLMYLLTEFGVARGARLEPIAAVNIDNPWLSQVAVPFEPNRSAILRDRAGTIWGVLGEYKPSVRQALKLPDYAAGFEIGPRMLVGERTDRRYVPLPRFPQVEQDICLKVPVLTTYSEVYQFVWGKLDELRPEQTHMTLGPIDIYQRSDDGGHKQITLRLSIASYEKTMTDEEVATLLDGVAQAAKAVLKAERI